MYVDGHGSLSITGDEFHNVMGMSVRLWITNGQEAPYPMTPTEAKLMGLRVIESNNSTRYIMLKCPTVKPGVLAVKLLTEAE